MPKHVLILAEGIGRGDEELGRVLMRNFLYAVARDSAPPAALLFMNGAVRLVCEGSDSLDDLRISIDRGVAVKACGTCLDYLGLKQSVVVGEVGTMVESVAALLADGEVLTIA